MAPPESLARHRDRTSRITAATLSVARREWMTLGSGDWDVAWRRVGPRLTALMVAGQVALGRESVQYVAESVEELSLTAPPVATVSPRGLAGTASDGRPLASLLGAILPGTRMLATKEMTATEALRVGQDILDRIVTTQMADARRAAESVSIVARPALKGMRRVAYPPCCPRCAILDGRFYRWSTGFERHPGCDCGMEPSDGSGGFGGDSGRALFDAGQVRGLSKADAQAIADGADPSQVINAHRGMTTAGGLKATTAGTTHHGSFGRRSPGAVRLRPEAIYELAGDREDALAMLRRFGYIF